MSPRLNVHIRSTLRHVARLSSPRAAVVILIAVVLFTFGLWPFFSALDRGLSDAEVTARFAPSAGPSDSGYRAEASVVPTALERIDESLERGMRARVTFVFRLYQRQPRFLRALGDTVVDEVVVEQTVSANPFTDAYRIVDSRGTEIIVPDALAVPAYLFTVSGVSLREHSRAIDVPVVRVRVVVQPLVISDSLFLIRAFQVDDVVRSGWVDAQPATEQALR